MQRYDRRLAVAILAGAVASLMWAGAAGARPRASSAQALAACKVEIKTLLVAEEANFASQGSYGTADDLVKHRMIRRRPALFVIKANSDGGVTISPTKPGGCPKSLAKTIRGRTTSTTAAASSASLVAACAELDRIAREDALGQPGNANVVADVLAFYERIKQVTQSQNPSSPQIAQLDSIISQLRALESGSPDQARAAALAIATTARTSLKATCGFS